jgi:hypothetical protein
LPGGVIIVPSGGLPNDDRLGLTNGSQALLPSV